MEINLANTNNSKDIQSGDVIKLRYVDYANSDNDEEDFYVMFIQNNIDEYSSYFLYFNDFSLVKLDEYISLKEYEYNLNAIMSLVELEEFNCEILDIIPHESMEITQTSRKYVI